MTNEDKIKVMAELDGFTFEEYHPLVVDSLKLPSFIRDRVHHDPQSLPRYLTSYDAIIPLLKKCWEAQLFSPEKFYQAIPNYYPHILTFVQRITPEQLCDALIKAVGQWKD